jgi:hypothetical protein
VKETNNNQQSEHLFDLHDILVALGERAIDSTWLGSGVECFGENADELYAYTDHELPISGHDLLRITSGIYQTIDGDFKAFDKGVTPHWLFIRAWDGCGFYFETDDPQIKELMKNEFSGFEQTEEVYQPKYPYINFFINQPKPESTSQVYPAQPPMEVTPQVGYWDPAAFAEQNKKNIALVSAFFLIDSLDAINKCTKWLSLLKRYCDPNLDFTKYFLDVHEIYELNRKVYNFDFEFRLYWENKELQGFLRCHFISTGKYEIELLLPGTIANEISKDFKDGQEGFCCAFMPPMFYD